MLEHEDTVSFDVKLKSIAEKGISLQQNSLTMDEFQKLAELIYRNRDLFATSMHDLVGTDIETIHIE